jgi:hypothetical protein
MLMRRQFGVAILVIASFLAAGAGRAAADVIIASNLPPNYQLSSYNVGAGYAGGTFTNEASAQEFTARASGTLTTLTSTIDAFDPRGLPLNVSIFTAAGGLPGALLGSVLIPPAQVSPDAFASLSSFDLTPAHVSVTAGQSYVMTLTVSTPVAGSVRYRGLLLNANPGFFGFQPLSSRDGGATWGPEGIPNEVGLTFFAAPALPPPAVPEPSSLALFGLGTAALAGWRKWRGRKGRSEVEAGGVA